MKYISELEINTEDLKGLAIKSLEACITQATHSNLDQQIP